MCRTNHALQRELLPEIANLRVVHQESFIGAVQPEAYRCGGECPPCRVVAEKSSGLGFASGAGGTCFPRSLPHRAASARKPPNPRPRSSLASRRATTTTPVSKWARAGRWVRDCTNSAFGSVRRQLRPLLSCVGSFGRYYNDGSLLTGGDYIPTTFDGEDAFRRLRQPSYQFRKGLSSAKAVRSIEGGPAHFATPNNKVRGSEIGLRLRARHGSTSRRAYSSRPTRPTAWPSRNIALARSRLSRCGRVSRSGLEGGALGEESLRRAAVSCA